MDGERQHWTVRVLGVARHAQSLRRGAPEGLAAVAGASVVPAPDTDFDTLSLICAPGALSPD
jgi:hypothetical protein